ncbi:hypothetical protein KCU62_g166, partial [Aureobasidium sp. EXF-3399]
MSESNSITKRAHHIIQPAITSVKTKAEREGTQEIAFIFIARHAILVESTNPSSPGISVSSCETSPDEEYVCHMKRFQRVSSSFNHMPYIVPECLLSARPIKI